MVEFLSLNNKQLKIQMVFFVLFLFLFLFLPIVLKSQCGTHLISENHINLDFINYSNSTKKFTPTDTLHFPIQFHVVVSENNQVDTNQLKNAVTYANSLYSNTKLKFYSCNQPNFIYSSSLEIIRNQTQENTLAQPHELPGMINVFLVDSVYIGDIPQCGYAYLPGGPIRIIMAASCLAPPSNTLAHELGHIFSLIHTHGESNTELTGELVNGSNCSTTGDYLCDTPADPNLASKVSTACKYFLQEKDLNGDVFQPDVANIMSYTRDKCALHFSNQQANQMYNAAYYFNLVNTRCYKPDAEFSTGIQVFPNPINEYCTINVDIAQSGNYKVEVIDVLGSTQKILLDQNLKVGQYKLIHNDWAQANLGIYFIVLSGENGSQAIKVIKN